MKLNKAADMYGLACENLKYSHSVLISIPRLVDGKIIFEKTDPQCFKPDSISKLFLCTNINKSEKDQDNYRRITVTATIGKLFE
jgi:hypothetical protein